MSEEDGAGGGKFGGFTEQTANPTEHLRPPPIVRRNQLAANSEGYRAAALKDGIAFRRALLAIMLHCPALAAGHAASRKAGLFPHEDEFLEELATTSGLSPFEKHLAGARSSYQALEKGGWTTGNPAAEAGFDLRLFYRKKQAGEQYGSIVAAARLGDRAAIGNGHWTTAHGGAIEALLDESTAELAKMEFSPLCSTTEASFKLKKAVPLHHTLRVDVKIERISGVRCWVSGTVTLPDSETVLATCEAQLADLQPILKSQRVA